MNAAESDRLGADLLIIFFLFLIASLPFFFHWARRYRLLKKIRDTPTSTARSAAVGLVELYGTSSGKGKSPISGAPCAYWNVLIELGSAKNPDSWEYLAEISSPLEFRLKDSTGSMLVRPGGAKADLPSSNPYIGSISNSIGAGPFRRIQPPEVPQLPPIVLNFLESLEDAKLRKRLDSLDYTVHRFRVTERLIPPDGRCYVLGDAKIDGGGLSVASGPSNLLFISDSDESTLVRDMERKMKGDLYTGLKLLAICAIIVLMLIFL